MTSTRRGLVAPQNTFLEAITRKAANQNCSFILASGRVVDYPIVYVSQSFVQVSGFSQNELLHRSAICSQMHGELTSLETVARLRQALQNNNDDQFEMLLYKKNRTPLWFLIHLTPVKSSNDVVALLLIMFRDITALKQPIPEQNGRGLSKFVWLARTVTRNRAMLAQATSASPQHPELNASNNNNNVSPASTGNHVTNHETTTAQPGHQQLEKTASLFSANTINIDATESTPFYRQEAPKTPPKIILHYSKFKSRWNWLILALTFYTAIMTPYIAAFESKTVEQLAIIIIDSVVDCVFLADVVMNFHTTFVGPAGEIVSDPRVIRSNYLKTWFVIDVLSCLPYDIINAFQQSPQQQSLSFQFGALKVIRLLRMTRVARKLHLYIEYGAAVLTLLLIMFVLIAHWFACIWFTIGNIEAHNGITFGWLQTLGRDIDDEYVQRNVSGEVAWVDGPPVQMAYVTALYFTMSCMTSVGFGNVSASSQSEKIFSIFMMIFGSLLYAMIFGNVTTIFQQMYSSTGRYHDMLNSIKEFMKIHQVPVTLSERVIDYVVSNWAVTKGIDATKVLNYCPKDMRGDLCIHLNRTVFAENPAFRLASNGCLRALAVHFTRIHCAPSDIVYHQGESLDSLSFIVNGSVEVIQDGEVVAILTKGDTFGDKFNRDIPVGQSMANVRALTYCDIHYIKRDNLLQVLELYQPFANSFARNLILSYNLRQRMVFRKIADVRRERELAERDKNGTAIDPNADQAVRKLIARFRNRTSISSSGSGENQRARTGSLVSISGYPTGNGIGNTNDAFDDSPSGDHGVFGATANGIDNSVSGNGGHSVHTSSTTTAATVTTTTTTTTTSSSSTSSTGSRFAKLLLRAAAAATGNGNAGTAVVTPIASPPATTGGASQHSAASFPLSPSVVSATKTTKFAWPSAGNDSKKSTSPLPISVAPVQTARQNRLLDPTVVTVAATAESVSSTPVPGLQRHPVHHQQDSAAFHGCKCCADCNAKVVELRSQFDHVTSRLDAIDRNMAAILDLLRHPASSTASAGTCSGNAKVHTSGDASTTCKAKTVDDSPSGLQHSSSLSTPSAATTQQQQQHQPHRVPPTVPRLAVAIPPAITPLTMDPITEQDEDSGLHRLSSDSRQQKVAAAETTTTTTINDVTTDVATSSSSSFSNKRLAIQHDLEML